MKRHEINQCCGTTCNREQNLAYVNELETVVAGIPEREKMAVLSAVKYAEERYLLSSQEALQQEGVTLLQYMEDYATGITEDRPQGELGCFTTSQLIAAATILLAMSRRVRQEKNRTFTPFAVGELLREQAAILQRTAEDDYAV